MDFTSFVSKNIIKSREAMEGKRYKCSWKKARNGTYFVGLVFAPRINAKGATFLHANENLSYEIR